MSYAESETDRLLSGMLMAGTIETVDYANARVRVRSGEWVSAWLPWFTGAAGQVRFWRPPSVGEQALILSPSGQPEQGMVFPGFYTDQHGQAPSDDPKLVLLDVPAGFTFRIRVGRSTLNMTDEGVVIDASRIDLNP